MYLILFLLLAVAAVFGGYYLLVHIIQLFTGCNKNEATLKIQRFFNGTTPASIFNDSMLIIDIENTIKCIIGNNRYDQLVQLGNTPLKKPLLFFYTMGIVPYLIISVPYKDDNEKAVIEKSICDVFISYLKMYGNSNRLIVEWSYRNDIKMPYLRLGFSTNAEQKRAIDVYLKNKQETLISNYGDITDDSEGILYE